MTNLSWMIARIRRMHNMKYSKDGSAMSMANFGHIQSKYLDIKPTDIIHDKSEIKNSKQKHYEKGDYDKV